MRSFGFGNRVAATRARLDELFPAAPAVLRDRYEHVLVRRDGHLLEVTINRPKVRNSLHPMANDELDHVSTPTSPTPICGSPFSPARARRHSPPATT